jgi:hypothetical protein
MLYVSKKQNKMFGLRNRIYDFDIEHHKKFKKEKISKREAMEKSCKNCKYWFPVDSMPNWGNCNQAGRRTKKLGKVLIGDVLRRYEENCFDFKPIQQLKNTANHRRRNKHNSPSVHSRRF